MVEGHHANHKLDNIRHHMKEHNLDCFVCFHMDAHNSEYIAPCDERVAFISGFKGSNGLCVITHDDARMWTDGRYYLAASKQLEKGWTMEKMEAGVTQWPEWIIQKFPHGANVGIDFTQYPAANLESRARSFEDAKINIKSVHNMVDLAWGSEKPAMPKNEVKHLDFKFTGQTTLDKFKRINERLAGKVDCLLVTTLDDICWVTNLRGADIDYNPVFFSYLIIYPGEETHATLYVDESKIHNLHHYLHENNIKVAPYTQIDEDLKKLNSEHKRVGVHTSTCNAELHRLVKENCVV